MVEVMAAGLGGANWALDAPSFLTGDRSPGAGSPSSPSRPRCSRLTFRSVQPRARPARQAWLHIPGRRIAAAEIELPDALVAEIELGGAA